MGIYDIAVYFPADRCRARQETLVRLFSNSPVFQFGYQCH